MVVTYRVTVLSSFLCIIHVSGNVVSVTILFYKDEFGGDVFHARVSIPTRQLKTKK